MLDLLPFNMDNEWMRAGSLFGCFLLLAIAVRLCWNRVLKRWVSKTESTLDDAILNALRGLVFWAIVLAGAYSGIQEITNYQEKSAVWPILTKGIAIGWVLLAVVAALRILNSVTRWRIEQAAERQTGPSDIATRVTFFGKLISAIVMFLGLLFALSVAGVDTSPLVAGGAISGVVIGIALQDTLSNVFAGFFLNIDQPIKIGDFIRIEGGEEGFVEEVGWRYTKVRLWSNNLLVIPNGKLSQSTLTNFNLPAEPLSIYVRCGVSYDSDLEHVEQVAVRVATEVQSTFEGGDTSWEPVVRYKEFGDSSINFVVVLRSIDVSAQYRIHHEFVKALHRAFGEEGIEIPFPIRTVLMKGSDAKSTNGV